MKSITERAQKLIDPARGAGVQGLPGPTGPIGPTGVMGPKGCSPTLDLLMAVQKTGDRITALEIAQSIIEGVAASKNIIATKTKTTQELVTCFYCGSRRAEEQARCQNCASSLTKRPRREVTE